MQTDIYAVIGDPVAHSLSPVMHNAAFRHLGMDAEYIPLQVKADNLPAFVHDARRKLKGFNITVPHKNAVIPFVDTLSAGAKLAGSVNTVKIDPETGTVFGDTTDGYGLECALEQAFGLTPRQLSITFIGCGGVVRALAFHLAAAGAHNLFFLNRTLLKAQELCGDLAERFPHLNTVSAVLSDTGAAEAFAAQSDLLLQCTSLGLNEDDPMPLSPELLPEHAAYFDTIYKETPLLCAARERGLRTANGLDMLLYQGAKSFSIWTGREAPVEVMREALHAEWAKRNA